jgi:hypothetical protein
MDNPENSGVDMKSDFVFFTKKQGNGGYMVFEGRLKDAAAFEKTLKQMDKDKEVVKEGDFRYMKSGRKQIISWNGSKFVMMSDFPYFNGTSAFSGDMDDEDNFLSADSLKFFAKDLMALKSSASLEKDDRFSDLLKESGDVHFWINADQYLSTVAGSYLSMLKVGTLLEGNAWTSILNFEDGRISFKSKSYYGKEMAKLMGKNKPRKVDAELLSRIPSNDVVGVLALNFDPASIMEFLKAAGFDGLVNAQLAELKLTADELINATKGQFLISVSDFQVRKKEVTIPGYGSDQPYTYTKTERDANVLVATSVNKKATFDKLLGMFEEKMKVKEDTSFNYQLNNDWFAVSNKKATVDQFLAGSKSKVPYADKITGNTFGMYIDLQRVFKGFGADLKDASDSASFDASLKMWEDVVGKGGEYKDGVVTGEFVINLVDKSKNSLKQINEYVEKIAAAQKLKKEEVWTNTDQIDSVMIDAPKVVAPVQH